MQVLGGPLKRWICSLFTAGGEVPATGDVLWEEVPPKQGQARHIRSSPDTSGAAVPTARGRGAGSTTPLLSSTSTEQTLGVITEGVQGSVVWFWINNHSKHLRWQLSETHRGSVVSL